MIQYGKTTRSVVKTLGAVFNDFTKESVSGWYYLLEEYKGNCKDDYLLGGKLVELSTNLKDSSQVLRTRLLYI